jgi:hypothetical protein
MLQLSLVLPIFSTVPNEDLMPFARSHKFASTVQNCANHNPAAVLTGVSARIMNDSSCVQTKMNRKRVILAGVLCILAGGAVFSCYHSDQPSKLGTVTIPEARRKPN